MSFSLYQAVVPTWVQILPGVAGMIDKAEAWCRENAVAPSELIGARLAPDMWDFATQVRTVHAHSAGALDAVRSGTFSPAQTPPPADFGGLRAMVDEALAKVSGATQVEIDAMVGGDTGFRFGEYGMDFTTENFLLSFSLPNFHFHATAAYAILRMKGVPVGKMDYLGKVRRKP